MKPNFDFQEKFGHIAHFMPDDDLMAIRPSVFGKCCAQEKTIYTNLKLF